MRIQTSFRTLCATFIVSSLLITSAVTNAAVIYSNSFETMPVGLVGDAAVKTAWQSRYAAGPDEGRVRIIQGGENVRSGKAAEVKYPAFGNSTSDSGATWETDFDYSSEDLYLSYWVKFKPGFDFVKGGKLPGLAGSEGFPSGANDFTARLMWRENGKLEFYLHGFNMMNSEGNKPHRVFWDDFGPHAVLETGRWHHIEMRVKMNTPGQRNGLLQGWLDGKLVCEDTDNANMRAAGQGATKINYLFFSTFFGGSSNPQSQWQPTTDVYAYYDDFVISTTRIGGGASSTPASSQAASSAPASSTPASSAPMSSSPGSSASSSSAPSTGCLQYSGAARVELNLNSSNCVQVAGGMSGKTLQVWDSDTNTSCDFRGIVSSVDGSGSLSVTSNYETSNSFTGNILRFNQSNGCRFVKMRAY